jgi:hypothetical protein
MTPIENKESDKYKTKKININWKEFFLKAVNQISAKMISSRNLRVIATRLWKVWLSGSFVCPLRNINRVTRAINEKAIDKIAISPKWKLNPAVLSATYPASKNSTLITIRVEIIF